MKKSKFFIILKYFKDKRGQIFPFFILVLVILFIATMAYVNISQVDTHKIDTMNAVDAGALAGASVLAQAANHIADINVNYLKKTFEIHFWCGTFRPGFYGYPTSRLIQYIHLATGQLSAYLDTCLTAYNAVQQSAAIAHTTTFGGMSIEEAEKREGSATGDRVKSDFSQWMDEQRFYDNRDENPTQLEYKWWPYQYDFEQRKQVQPDFGNDARAEKIITTARKPSERTFELTPTFPIPQVTIYFAFCADGGLSGVCDPEGDCGSKIFGACGEMVGNMIEGETAILAIFGLMLWADLFDDKAPGGMKNILDDLESWLIAPVIGWIQPWTVQLVCPPAGEPCGCFYFNAGLGTYRVPVPWIKELKSNNAEVNVQVTRFSPTKDLGLWQFKHGSITSGARAGIYGGSIHRFPGKYKIRINEVWDGERNL